MSRKGRALCGILALAFGIGPATAGAQRVRSVVPGVPIESDLAPGRVDAWEVRLSAGEFLHLAMEQNHLDASVRILSSTGAELAQADNAAGEDDPVTLSVIATRGEILRIEIRLRSAKSARGQYRLSVDPPRPAAPDDARRIDAERLRAVADALAARGSADGSKKALAQYETTLPVWRAIGDRREEAVTLGRISETLWRLGDLRQALSRAQEALELSQCLGERAAEGAALDRVGVFFSEVGEQQEGLEYLDAALDIRRAEENPVEVAETMNNIAVARAAMGEYAEAVSGYTEALKYVRSDDLRAMFLKNRAVNYAILGESDRARDDLQAALATFRALGNSHLEAIARYSLGNVYVDQNEPAEALRQYAVAVGLLRRSGDKRTEAVTVNHMGLAHLAAGKPGMAVEEFRKARAMLLAAGDRRREAAVLVNVGRADLALGRTADALACLREALPRVRASGDRGNEATALLHLARAEQSSGDLDSARRHVEEALRLTESVRGSIPALGERALYLAKTRDRYDLLIDILMDLHAKEPQKGCDAEALHASERSKARSLVELLQEARIDLGKDVAPNLLARERTLEARLEKERREEEQRLAEPRAAPESSRALDALLAEYEDVQGQLRARDPRFAALERPQPLGLEGIRKEVLDSRTLLLEYALGEKRSFLWAATTDALESFTLPPRRKIEAAARRLFRAWSDPNRVDRAEADRRARAMSRMLLGPVANRLGHRRLAIVVEGALQYLPFAALPAPARGDGPSEPIIVRHDVVSLPSATTLAVLRREGLDRRTPGKRVAVLADPVFDRRDPRVAGNAAPGPSAPPLGDALTRSIQETGLRRLERLPSSRREARAIAALAGENESFTALDFEASRPVAMGARIANARIVHFATHTLLDAKHPELSGIVLSLVDERGRPEDGFLQTRDIYNLKLSADLVVLSSCQTAIGRDVRGEGLLGLSRGFMYAGAPRIVASLWKVPDRATADLMERFYRGMLVRHLRPAAALRDAQREIRKTRVWSSPYYWAAFTLQGDWN